MQRLWRPQPVVKAAAGVAGPVFTLLFTAPVSAGAVLQVSVPTNAGVFREVVERDVIAYFCAFLSCGYHSTQQLGALVWDNPVLLDLVEQGLIADAKKRGGFLPVPAHFAKRRHDDVPFCAKDGLVDSFRQR